MNIQELEQKFNKDVITLLNDFPNYPQGTYDLNAEVKSFMYRDLNNPHVKNFIKRLASRYLKLFTNQDLINCFDLPRSHYRNIKIYSNLPLTKNRYYDTYLFNLFNFDSTNFYDMCKSLFELAEINGIEYEKACNIIDYCVLFEKEMKQ